MNAITELREAAIGWFEMLTARPDAAERFSATRGGIVNALVIYFLAIVVVLTVQSVAAELPNYADVFLAVLLNALPLLGIAAAIGITITLLRSGVAFAALFVPATYATTFVLVMGLPLSLFMGPGVSNALLGVLGYMLYREARDIGKMSIGLSIAFAALTIVALVALPAGLYMLSVPPAVPA